MGVFFLVRAGTRVSWRLGMSPSVGFESNFCSDSRPDCPLVGVSTRNARSIQKEAQYRRVTRNDRSRSFSISNPAAKTQQRTKWSQPDIENRPNGTTTIDWLQHSTVQLHESCCDGEFWWSHDSSYSTGSTEQKCRAWYGSSILCECQDHFFDTQAPPFQYSSVPVPVGTVRS